jgi:hypothetical protein
MLASERRAGHSVASKSGRANGAGLSPEVTNAADLTPTAAWSRRVRWIGGLIQAAFAGFWLVRGSVVIGGRAADVLIAVFGVTVIGGSPTRSGPRRAQLPGREVLRAGGSSEPSRSRP